MGKEKETKVVPKVEVGEAKEPVVREGKDAIYDALGKTIQEMTGKRVGLTGGRKVFDQAVEAVFAEATKEGSFRFNGGFGSLHVKTYGAGERRLPSGVVTKFGERKKVRYEEGVVVSGLVENGGDLAKVKALRGADSPAGGSKSAAGGEDEVNIG